MACLLFGIPGNLSICLPPSEESTVCLHPGEALKKDLSDKLQLKFMTTQLQEMNRFRWVVLEMLSTKKYLGP